MAFDNHNVAFSIPNTLHRRARTLVALRIVSFMVLPSVVQRLAIYAFAVQRPSANDSPHVCPEQNVDPHINQPPLTGLGVPLQ